MTLEPFTIPFSVGAVDDLRDRLRRTRWPDEVSGAPWEYGFDLTFLQDLCRYWNSEFDWKTQVATLSAFHHYRYTSDGIGVHFMHERGTGRDPIPLVITHGWPGSFLEMLRIIPLLTDPAANGGDPSDSWVTGEHFASPISVLTFLCFTLKRAYSSAVRAGDS